MATDRFAKSLRVIIRDAAIYGFIVKEQSDLMTLARSTDASFEVMLDALLVAIEYIGNDASC